MRHKLVQRRIKQTDCHAIAVHSLEDALEVATLHGEKFGKRDTTALDV